MSIWNFAELLPKVNDNYRISLGEGNTPLVRSRRIGPSLGVERLYFKLETTNPTGSYKDRFAALAISDMLSQGKSRCIASSSGNTGAALAAYCAAAELRCEIAIVATAPHEKLVQMLAYGATLRRVKQFGIDADITKLTCERLEQLGHAPDSSLQISAFRYSPVGMQGVQTISYELRKQLPIADGCRRHVFVPAGGGGLSLAIARGFDHASFKNERIARPAVHVVQPEGNDTIATALRSDAAMAREVTCTSAISGLQVPSVIDGNEVLAACRESDGNGQLVSDEAIWETQARLAKEEGVFCEPAGAVSLCGALQAISSGEISRDAIVVCIVTGSGFKDAASWQRAAVDHRCEDVEYSSL